MSCVCDDHKNMVKDLVKIKEDSDTWDILFKCKVCGSLWEEYYPMGERHGSGPRAMRKVSSEYTGNKYGVGN